jgi:hypothetical protein
MLGYENNKTIDVDLSNLDVSRYHENNMVKTSDVIVIKKPEKKNEFNQGNLKIAIDNYYELYGVCQKDMNRASVCCSNLDILPSYGEGLRLYFTFMKAMTTLFILCALISGFLCYINFRG